jgi:hypothetical protein
MRNHCLKGIFLFFIVFSACSAIAQNNIPIDTLREHYNRETLHLMYGYPAKGMNGDKISNQELRELFSKSPDGLIAYEKSRSKRTTATILLATGTASAIAAIAVSQSNRKLSQGLLLGSLGLNLLSIFPSKQSKQMLDRAIWLYNRDVLLPPQNPYSTPNYR